MPMRAFKIGLLLLLALAAGGVLLHRSEPEVLALARIDPVPQTRELKDRGRYAEAAEYLGFFMDYDYVRSDPDAQNLEREIAEVRGSPLYRADKPNEGLVTGASYELAGGARVASVLGYLRSGCRVRHVHRTMARLAA